MKFFFLLVILTIGLSAFSQQIKSVMGIGHGLNIVKPAADDTAVIITYINQVCKKVLSVHTSFNSASISTKDTVPLPRSTAARRTKLLSLHGNVSYDFVYRSKSDTALLQQGFNQHTERIYVNALWKEKYPFKVALVLRQSNSSYFRNFADIGLQFDKGAYYKRVKQELINKISASSKKIPLDSLQHLIEEKEKALFRTRSWLESPAVLQKIIEERERQYSARTTEAGFGKIAMSTMPFGYYSSKFRGKALSPESLLSGSETKKDSLAAPFYVFYQHKKEESDSLSAELSPLRQKRDSIKQSFEKSLANLKQKINQAPNLKELKMIAADHEIDMSPQSTFERKLGSVKNISLGRSLLNYTELTAQNITITGLNIEYNPSYYAAFAAGKVNYPFRSFLHKNTAVNGQYLVLGRLGIGNSEKRALILTVFQGRKSFSGYATNATAVNHINIVGYSVESIFKRNENTGFSFEVAKSTKPITGDLLNNKHINSLWKFNDRTNFGINIKGQTILKATETRLSGFYRKTGENYQSFSLFTYRTDQTAWLARADQHLFKQKVNFTAMLRRNDFTNPFTEKTYKTSTVFKSAILNIRLRGYPSLSLGYYPGTQLYLVNKETIHENAYYLLNGSLVHNYVYKDVRMNTSLVYNHYFNKATDSGFVFYRGASYYGVQTLFLRRLQVQASASYNNQPGLTYATVETSGDYSLKDFLKIGLGVKYNKVHAGNYYWGESIQVAADLKQTGRLQVQYQKSHLPSLNQTLHSIEMGRISWYKFF